MGLLICSLCTIRLSAATALLSSRGERILCRTRWPFLTLFCGCPEPVLANHRFPCVCPKPVLTNLLHSSSDKTTQTSDCAPFLFLCSGVAGLSTVQGSSTHRMRKAMLSLATGSVRSTARLRISTQRLWGRCTTRLCLGMLAMIDRPRSWLRI